MKDKHIFKVTQNCFKNGFHFNTYCEHKKWERDHWIKEKIEKVKRTPVSVAIENITMEKAYAP